MATRLKRSKITPLRDLIAIVYANAPYGTTSTATDKNSGLLPTIEVIANANVNGGMRANFREGARTDGPARSHALFTPGENIVYLA